MLDRPQMPPPPEGCVYGPWWDEGSELWKCLVQALQFRVLMFSFCPHDETWKFNGVESSMARELLRLAKELEQKEARIKELEKELEWRVRADEQ